MSEQIRRIEEEFRRREVNLYDFALMTEEGIEEFHAENCNACNNSYSVTKAFIATAAGMLWERGKLDLDRPVTGFFPGYALADERWNRVTLRHALTHTMGIGKGYLDIDVEDIWSYGTEDFMEMVFREKLPYEPGTHYQYSDAAYYLAARVVEEAAGERADGFLMRELGIDEHEAGMLLSVCGDLRICQIVDPEKTCRMELPRSVTKAFGYEFA